jgi:hypothetical protein
VRVSVQMARDQLREGTVTEMRTATSGNGTEKAQRQHFVRTTVVLVGWPVVQVVQQPADWGCESVQRGTPSLP